MMKVKYRSKKFLFLIILITLVGIFGAYLSIGRLSAQGQVVYDNIKYDRSQFVDASHLPMDSDKLVAENNNFELHFDETTTYFYVLDKATGVKWKSNPQVKDPSNPITSIKNKQNSTLIINYTTQNGTSSTSFDNYSYSINHSNGDQTYAVNYLDDAVQVLYEIEKRGIDENYFPQKMSLQRMQDAILSNPNMSSLDLLHMSVFYEKDTQDGYYYLTNAGSITQTEIDGLYSIFYEKCGYTIDDLQKDNEEFGISDDLSNPTFEVAVEYRLTEQGLVASVISDSIVDTPNYPITSINFLPYFGAAASDTTGYFVIPDGSGAIMNFNNGKNYVPSYSKNFYGDDSSLQQTVQPEQQQDLLFPIYGIVNTTNQSGMLAIIEKGASMATLNADVSGRNDSYNKINTTVKLRISETSLFVNRGEEYNVPTWTNTKVASDYAVDFQFVSGNNASYYGLAKQYQNYLVSNQGLTKKDNTTKTVLNLDLLGMFEEKKFFLGVPYQSTQSLTTFDEATSILKELKNSGINNINLMYDGWFNDSMDNSLPTSIQINGAIGGNADFEKLIQYTNANNIGLYPTMNLMSTSSYPKPFDQLSYTAQHINGKVSMLSQYNLATDLISQDGRSNYVINPVYYSSIITKMLNSYNQFSIGDIGINDLGSELGGNYKKDDYTFREDAEQLQISALNQLSKDNDITLYSPYGYAATYASNILNVPLESTQYPILDESIPFYQLVFNGYIDYSGVSVNEDSERGMQYQFLKAIESGSNVDFVWSYKDSSILLNTNYNEYYSTNYLNWINSAEGLVQQLNTLKISESPIINHEILADNVYRVTYQNGNEFIINYNQVPYNYDNQSVGPNNYLLLGGDSVENN